MRHLFGSYDPISIEWIDGIVSSTFRQFANENTNNSLKWIIFDGPIHINWIENLNTVLDDNRKLCLSSGEVLHLNENTTIIFETNSLSNASPSTVNNFEIQYISFAEINWIYF